jgi:hypothetical protein
VGDKGDLFVVFHGYFFVSQLYFSLLRSIAK